MTSPELVAQFVLDEEGEPTAIDRDGVKHYYIDLKVVGAPEDAFAANYKLDESYYDPERESRNRDGFIERITSFGDYPVQVQLRTRTNVATIADDLSRALERGIGENTSPALQRALSDIKRL